MSSERERDRGCQLCACCVSGGCAARGAGRRCVPLPARAAPRCLHRLPPPPASSACLLRSYTYTAEDVARVLKEKKAAGQAPRNIGERAAGHRLLHSPAACRRALACRAAPACALVPHLQHWHDQLADTPSVLCRLCPAALERARVENELSHAREKGDAEKVAE